MYYILILTNKRTEHYDKNLLKNKKRYYTRKPYDYNDDTTHYTESNHFIPLKGVDKVATYQVIQKRESYKYQKEDALFKSAELSATNHMTSAIDLDSIIAKNRDKKRKSPKLLLI